MVRRALLTAALAAGCGAALRAPIGPLSPLDSLVAEALHICPGCDAVADMTVRTAEAWVSPGSCEIRYDPIAMEAVRLEFGDDAAFGVLAHEAGHCATISAAVTGPQRELDADRWAGAALCRLGRSPDPLAAYFADLPGGDTHPPGAERVDAVLDGCASVR